MRAEELKKIRNAIVLGFGNEIDRQNITDSEILRILRSSVKENWSPKYHLSSIEPVEDTPHAFVCLYEGDGYMDFGEFINPADFLEHELRFKWNYSGFAWIEEFLTFGIKCCTCNYPIDSRYSTDQQPGDRNKGNCIEDIPLLERLTVSEPGPSGTMNEVQILELIGEEKMDFIAPIFQDIEPVYVLYLDCYMRSINNLKKRISSGEQIDLQDEFDCKYYKIKDLALEISKVEQIEKSATEFSYFYMKGIYQGESIIFTVDSSNISRRIGRGSFGLGRVVKASPSFEQLSFSKKKWIIGSIIGDYSSWNADLDKYGW